MPDAMVLCRFVHFTLVLMLFGAWVFKPLLAPGESTLDASLLRISRWLAVVALVSGIAWLLLITATLTGRPDAAFDPAMIGKVLGKTFFGEVWVWHLLLNVLLMGVLWSPLRNHLPLRLMLSGLLLSTLAPIGHGALLDGLSGQLLILNQIVHLICVGAWLGGLMWLVMILRQPGDHDVRVILRRFSGIGYALVAGLVITGLINVRVLTGQFWPTPWLSGFALILLIKVVLVGLMLGLALFNRMQINGRELRMATLRTSVMLEWLLGIGAVAAVSLLGTLPPMIAG
ncbi:Inner membrane protein YebZ [Pseudomonas fluorescens]|uniref:Copper resistance protein D n=1 Tax=Pseudomonas fluorescens TaxID=294 RepID=A0A5E6QIP0_PSEFL|nr:copper homeostasis membrane protein CopD [Pseudomonas fluorescens]VVM55189.1 Inner membrane protein YebZ [Pseudomonas fluorescens]